MMPVFGACETGKIGYLEDIDAMLAILHLGAKHDGNEKQERSYYQCDRCDLLHLTSWRIV